MKRFLLPGLIFILIAAAISCKKESFITSPDARLYSSTDTLKFDTVFTSVGSVSKSFKIFNDNSQKLRISSIKLMGGATSAFKMNVNGTPAAQVNDLDIAANDSIYVFVTVSVNPNTANLPFVLTDSIQVSFNGISKFIQLEAYGQNGIFLNNTVIASNTAFNNKLPYVISGKLTVNAGILLTIEAGARIFCHANTGIIIRGSVVSNGTLNDPVIFTGDRLDDPYDKFPASWAGITFSQESHDNTFTYTIIKNADQALSVVKPSPNSTSKLVLHQCSIYNAKKAGIISEGSSVTVDNSLFYNSGSCLVIRQGGTYSFTNCTFAGYSTNFLFHTAPVAILTNYLDTNNVVSTFPLSAIFKNCIFWGEDGAVENEITIDRQGSSSFNVTLDHCLYKASTDPPNSTILSPVKNQDPEFDSIDVRNNFYNFRTTNSPSSPVVSAGTATSYLKDLDFFTRNPVKPDIGSYEKH